MSVLTKSIAINATMLDNRPSGVGIYAAQLINHFQREWNLASDEAITVFTPTRRFLKPGIRIVKVSDLLQSSRFGTVAAVTRFLWNSVVYPLHARRFDLTISPTTHGSLAGRNQIVTIHDLLSLRFGKIRPHQKLYYRYLLPFIVRRAALVIAISEATRQDIIHFLGCPEEKIHVLHNGYDPSEFNPGDAPSTLVQERYDVRNYWLIVGPSYEHKNIDLVLRAYRELPVARREEHPLVIVGGRSRYLGRLKELAATLGINRHVHFLGYVPQRLMPAVYREAFALVFPSLFEGFGFPLLEAMACGCPVISSNTSSMPEVCGEAALYIDPTEQRSLLQAMTTLADNADLRQHLIDKGLVQAKRFSWSQTAKELKSIVENYLFHS